MCRCLFGCALALAGAGVYAQAAAPQCSAEKIAAILAPAAQGQNSIAVNCSATLPPSSVVTKNLVFTGAASSNLTFDCNGARLIRQGKGDSVVIRSLWRNGTWSRPQNITLRSCNIEGALRIIGMGVNDLWQASRIPNNTPAIQAAAPSHIELENLTITGNGRIPFYVSPGATYVTLKNSTILGQTDGTAIYLDAESAHNTLVGNIINTSGKREALAVDGSAYNLIENNRFLNVKKGGIFLYRNCGERGVIRQQTPSYNIIRHNYFANQNASRWQTIVWLGSRNGRASYCGQDAGYPFGSSIDNGDFAENNTVENNTFDRYRNRQTLKADSTQNTLSGNREQ